MFQISNALTDMQLGQLAVANMVRRTVSKRMSMQILTEEGAPLAGGPEVNVVVLVGVGVGDAALAVAIDTKIS